MNSVNTSYKKLLFVNFFNLLNVAFVTLFFSGAWYFLYAHIIVSPYFKKGNYVIIIIFAVLYASLVKLYGGFKVGVLRVSELIYSNIIAVIVSSVTLYVLVFLLAKKFVNPIGIIWLLICGILWCMLWAMWANRFYFMMNKPKQTIMIYGNETSLNSLNDINKARFKIISKIHMDDINEGYKFFEITQCVFLCGVPSEKRNEILKKCIKEDTEVYIRPHISDIILSGSKRISLCNVPVLHCSRSAPSAWFLIVKRILDISISLTGIIVFSPIMLVVAFAIKSYDKGSAIYKQRRLTTNGKAFNILKFRTMRQDAESDGRARLATEKDNRITPIGKFLRAIRFDELPQLFNILRGDMSIVGPRPERPEIAEQYKEELPEFDLRLQVKAGLTGYAQVYGKYNTSPYDKLQMDLMYIANQSLIEDIKIIMTTIKILFMPESTQGVAEGQETADVK